MDQLESNRKAESGVLPPAAPPPTRSGPDDAGIPIAPSLVENSGSTLTPNEGDGLTVSAREHNVVGESAHVGGPVEVETVAAPGFQIVEGGETFHAKCEEIRFRLAEFQRSFSREVLAIADLLAAAKCIYDRELGTGRRGKRNPESVPGFVEAAARAIGRSPSLVEKYLQISKIDARTRELMAEHPALLGSVTGLLKVARETDPERRGEAVLNAAEQLEEKDDSPLGQRYRRDEGFRRIAKRLLSPADELGGIADAIPLPEPLTDLFPELGPSVTFGQARQAVRPLVESGASRAARGKSVHRLSETMQLAVGEDVPVILRKARFTARVTKIVDVNGNPVDGATVHLAFVDTTARSDS